MSALIIVMIITGVIIWDEYFITFTTIEVKRVAVLVHAAAAILAIMIWIVHVYAGVWVQGSLGAMTSGQVTGGWAWKHHRKWLKQLVGGKVDEDMRPPLTKT
jgi:formate dehydrogenase subunit gamma